MADARREARFRSPPKEPRVPLAIDSLRASFADPPRVRMTVGGDRPAAGTRPLHRSGLRVWWAAGEALRRSSSRSPGLWWIRRVNRRIGAFIALGLIPTRVSPNVVSVAGLVVTGIGAVLVATRDSGVSLGAVVLIFAIWQLAFSLDCADGQLARARGQSSRFGAWLDQVLDFVSHTVVFTALTIFAVRTNDLEEPFGAAFGATIATLSVIQLFAGSQRNAIMGTAPATTAGGRSVMRWLALGRHLTDYGATLGLTAVLLLWPIGLFWFLVASSAFNALAVTGQIAANWIAEGRAAADGS